MARAGRPDPQALEGHRFVGAVGVPQRIPWAAWMEAHVAPGALALRTTDQHVLQAAVRAGLGLGFLAEHDAAEDPGLVTVLPPSEEWSVQSRSGSSPMRTCTAPPRSRPSLPM